MGKKNKGGADFVSKMPKRDMAVDFIRCCDTCVDTVICDTADSKMFS